MKTQKTTLVKKQEITRDWHELDAAEFTLGRLATRVAHLLRGKHKTTYSPHQDAGDFVVIKNADKVKFTGRNKLDQKEYHHYSGYPGGLKTVTLRDMMAKDSTKVVRLAIKRMLPDNRLRKIILRRLKIVKDGSHNYPITK